MKRIAILFPVALAACATEAPPPRPLVGGPPPPTYTVPIPSRVVGQSARGLTQLFGAPQLDVTEGTGRRMQFGSRICVLDAYLYPKNRDGSGEAVVTHVDARQRNGSAIDGASCVAALTRREGGK